MILRITALAALLFSALLAQSGVAISAPTPTETASEVPLLRGDEDDALVVRARDNLAQVTKLVNMGALPLVRLKKAQEEVQDALDMSLLKKSLYNKDLLPEQTEQMVSVAQLMVLRRQRSLMELQELVSAGVIARSEAQASTADLARAAQDLEWAQARARLIVQLSENIKIEKGMASLESQVETHPEWSGKVYTKYDGNGLFTTADRQTIEIAFRTRFAKSLPISADGETAVHRSFGFDHRGRIDVALNPTQPEGEWLIHFLESKRIPYFAFRAAVPHMATGAHIHLGPQSTKLVISY